MNILAIDTSNQVLGLALVSENQVIGEYITNVEKNHSTRLMPAVEQLMKDCNLVPSDLDKIVVANGPGSYTGVRIGVTTAKTIAFALNIPVIGVSSLEALALQGQFFEGLICPFFDARRGLVFTGLYEQQDNKVIHSMDDQNILFKDWLGHLKKIAKPILFLSPDIVKFQEEIIEELGELAMIPGPEFHVPQPARLGFTHLYKEATPVHELDVNYLRLAEAEAKWLKQQEKDMLEND